MLDFNAAVELLKSGQGIERKGSNRTGAVWFLKNIGGKQYLFQRSKRANSTETVESPAVFDWDDAIATNWQAV